MAKELTELEQLEIEERKVALESRKIQDELARLQLAGLKAELEMKTNNKTRGAADAKKAIEDRDAMRARCNHHTGGEGAIAISQGQGDPERPTCIGAVQMLDERIRLTCGRCNDVCWSDDPDRRRWAYWVGLWRRSVNKQMMIVGGLKIVKQPQISAT